MNEIKLKHLDISCYEYTLKNGLEVILIPFKNKKKYIKLSGYVWEDKVNGEKET